MYVCVFSECNCVCEFVRVCVVECFLVSMVTIKVSSILCKLICLSVRVCMFVLSLVSFPFPLTT